MRYELNGGWTEIIFLKTKKGFVPFPSANAFLVKIEGTSLSRTHLKEKIGKERYDKLGGGL